MLADIVYQHAEDASALWHRRQLATNEPHYSFQDLQELDQRVYANIEGLLVAGDGAISFITDLIQAEDEGALFSLALIALETGNSALFQEAITLGKQEANLPLAQLQIQSALAWANPKFLSGIVKNLLASSDAFEVVLGLNACEAHRKISPKLIEPYLYSEDLSIRSCATRVVANAGYSGLLSTINSLAEQATEINEFECLRAKFLLGEAQQAAPALAKLVLKEESCCTRETLALYFSYASPKDARSLLKQLDELNDRQRDVIIGFGVLGDPVAIPWLTTKMEQAELNRLAGESISMITGLDIVEEKLDLDMPLLMEADSGPNDNPDDDNVTLDEDEDLPWVDLDLITRWWQSQSRYQAGTRYLNGDPIGIDTCNKILHQGLQRHRLIATTTNASISADTPFLDTTLPSARQFEHLL